MASHTFRHPISPRDDCEVGTSSKETASADRVRFFTEAGSTRTASEYAAWKTQRDGAIELLPTGVPGKVGKLRAFPDPWPYILQPLREWPSDLIREHEASMLRHGFIVEAILTLSRIAQDPRTVKNSTKLNAKELAVVAKLRPSVFGRTLRDEVEPDGLRSEAVAELDRIFRLLIRRRARQPRQNRAIRTLLKYNRLRGSGLSEKDAVKSIKLDEGRKSGDEVRSDIRRARETTGSRVRPYRERRRRTIS